MKKTYDLIIIGAGLSSLMFISHYTKKFNKQSILLLEQKKYLKRIKLFVFGKAQDFIASLKILI